MLCRRIAAVEIGAMVDGPSASELGLTLRLALAGLLAAVLGWQRYRAGRPAGVRTHALVAMAAGAFALAGAEGFAGAGPHDPTRIAAQVVTGIGFLGAGTIFRARDHVYGLTTAATLWFAAALGVLIAAGLVWTAVLATVLALFVLTVVDRIEKDPRYLRADPIEREGSGSGEAADGAAPDRPRRPG
jgi:putative Mg2+ transporter-C (MgtC) family protein